MKGRVSVASACYSIDRSEKFEAMCNNLLFDKKLKIEIDGNDVYYFDENKKEYLLEITNPKTTWFEIWLKLREV